MEEVSTIGLDLAKHVFVGCIVVQDDVDQLAGRHVALDPVQKADELLVPVPLHALADHRAVERVEGPRWAAHRGPGALPVAIGQS